MKKSTFVKNAMHYVLHGFRSPRYNLGETESVIPAGEDCAIVRIIADDPEERWASVAVTIAGPVPKSGKLHPLWGTIRTVDTSAYSVILPATLSIDRRSATVQLPLAAAVSNLGPLAVKLTYDDHTTRDVIATLNATFHRNHTHTVRIPAKTK